MQLVYSSDGEPIGRASLFSLGEAIFHMLVRNGQSTNEVVWLPTEVDTVR